MAKRAKGRGRGHHAPKVQAQETEISCTAGAVAIAAAAPPPQFHHTDTTGEVLCSRFATALAQTSSTSSDSGIEDKQQTPPFPETSQFEDAQTSLSARAESLSCRRVLTTDTNGYVSLPTMSAVGYHKMQRMRRPGYGTMAHSKRKIMLVSNLYKLSCNLETIYYYDVNITPRNVLTSKSVEPAQERRALGRDLCRQIIFELVKITNHFQGFLPVFDGYRNLYTAKPLPLRLAEEYEVSFPVNNKTRSFIVVIKPVIMRSTNNNMISLKMLPNYFAGETQDIPLEVRRVYETILSFRTPGFPQININTSFFFTSSVDNKFPLSSRAEMWLGYNQSVRFTEKGAAVVINITAATFFKSGPAIGFLAEFLRSEITPNTILAPKEKSSLEKTMKNIRIQVNHQRQKRKYCILGLSQFSAREQMFEMTQNGMNVQKSVEAYFAEAYNYRLKYPKLPCFSMRSGKSANNVYVPIEVCDILPGQRLIGSKLNPSETAKMIRQTAMPVSERFNKIEETARRIQEISAPYLQEFALQLDMHPIRVPGRVLDQPKIAYDRGNSSIMPNELGSWDMRNQNFLYAADVDNWVILDFSDCPADIVQRFASLLWSNGKNIGLNWKQPRIVSNREFTKSVEEHFQIAKKNNISLIVVILSENGFPSYEEIKFFGDTKYNLVTQCIKLESVTGRKCNEKLAVNLCLKINSKLGGINHTISSWPMALGKESVIVFGADVIHDIALLKTCSIAALVGVIDYQISRYAVSCRIQNNPKGGESQEIILSLKEMVISIMKAYYKNLRQKPQKILFYRDGVSEGQFQHVLEKEIPMIKAACKELEPDYQPPITFVIVQKRHQIRIRPENPRDGIGRQGSKNVPTGTTVDTDIIDPVNFDFYLCSHEGIQGTSKPSHYTVLFDENRVTADVIQSLSYYLCHVYARSNRSISIPAPVKYADLLATRAKDFVTWKSKSFIHSRYEVEQVPAEIDALIKSIEKYSHKMFFV